MISSSNSCTSYTLDYIVVLKISILSLFISFTLLFRTSISLTFSCYSDTPKSFKCLSIIIILFRNITPLSFPLNRGFSIYSGVYD